MESGKEILRIFSKFYFKNLSTIKFSLFVFFPSTITVAMNTTNVETVTKKRYGRIVFQICIVMLFILTAIFAFMTVATVSTVRMSSIRTYEEFSVRIAKEEAEKISNWNDVLINDLRIYSDNDIMDDGTTDDIIFWLRYHKEIRNPNFNYVLFCTLDGVGYSDDGNVQTVISTDFFQAIVKRGEKTYVSNLEFQYDGTACYYIARPAYNRSKKMVGIVAGSVKSDALQQLINSTKLGDARSLVCGSDGIALCPEENTGMYMDLNYTDKIGFRGWAEIAANLKTTPNGTGAFIDAGGVDFFTAWTSVPGTPWIAFFNVPMAQINTDADRMRGPILLLYIAGGVAITLILGFMIRHQIKPLKLVRNSITEIATGNADLTQRVAIKSNNEIEELGDRFNDFMVKMQDIITGLKESKNTLEMARTVLQQRIGDNGSSIENIINDIDNIDDKVDSQVNSVSQTASAVEEISKNIESLERMIESQSAAVTQASAAVEEMIGNIRNVNGSVGHMAHSFDALSDKAAEGIKLQEDVNQRIMQIETQSKSLQEANTVISSIASQTNLLAMNAAIEAAHAGDAGRGFSVVADEIRKLSETSASQTKRIKVELKNISKSIAEVVDASQASRQSFNAVTDNINQTQQLVVQIKAAMEEQEIGSQQIGDSLKNMNDSTLEVQSASKEMLEGNKLILNEVNQLRESSKDIRLSMNQITDSTNEMKQTGAKLDEIAQTVTDTVAKIGQQVDLFTV